MLLCVVVGTAFLAFGARTIAEGRAGDHEIVVGGLLGVLGIAVLLIGMLSFALLRSSFVTRRASDTLSARLRIASDNAGIGFWDRDLRTGRLEWDATMHRIYGTDPAITTPSSELWTGIVHPDDIEQTNKLFNDAVKGLGNFETTFRIVRPDGAIRDVRTSATVVRNESGIAERVVGANWDVTDQAETERRLENTATRLSLAMQAARIGLWDVRLPPDSDRLETQQATCDEMLHKMLGYDPGELNSPNTQWHALCHPDDLDEMRDRCRGYLRGEDAGYRWDYRVRAKWGDWVWIHDAGKVVERDSMGRPTRMVGVRMLVDEQKRSETALRSVVCMNRNDGEDALEGMARSLAEAFDVMFVGIARYSDESGTRRADLIGGWHRGEPAEPVTYDLAGTPCEIASEQDFCIFNTGVCDRFPADAMLDEIGADSYAGATIVSSDGTPLGVLHVVDDKPLHDHFDYEAVLTVFAAWAATEFERMELESTLRKARDEAERTSEFKSTLVANVSHEIRTPLSAMIGYAELLSENADRSPQAVADFASTIARNGAQLLALVNDLLDCSKIGAGLMSIEQVPASPGEIASDAIELLGHRAVAKGIALEVRCESPIPSLVISDPARMRQIIVNLVGNAVKFTESGTVTLGVGYDNDAQTLRFVIEDTGIGIDPEAMGSLFAPFRQAEASTTRRFGGTGLGLSISRDLAHLLGGEITVESERGVGSVFTVSLNAPPAEGAIIQNPEAFFAACAGVRPRISEIGPVRPAMHGVNVMLVEDSRDNRRLLSFHLQRAGARVVEAGTGAEALCLIAERPDVDLIVTDLQMPVLDGYALVEELRATGNRTPIIALTANASREDEARCLSVGCDAYETKPISREHLIGVCLRVLGREEEGSRAA